MLPAPGGASFVRPATVRATLTDSLGGLGDNGGAWRVDQLLFD